VQEGSPAAQAGLTNDDLIVRLDGEKVTGVDDLFRILDERRIDTDVTVTVVRGGVSIDITVRPIDREQAQ
jgi:S1-C subfamily serine protease